jgi:hypothetical protein
MAILLFLERTLLLGFYGLPILWVMLDCIFGKFFSNTIAKSFPPTLAYLKEGSPIHGGNTAPTYDVTESFSRLRWGRNESRAYSSSLSFHESSKWDLKHYATLQQVASLGDVKVPSILLFQVHCFLSLSLHLGIIVFSLILFNFFHYV